MDPFSLSVGILSVIGTISTSLKAIDHVIYAEKDFNSFATELESIRNVVEEIKGLPNYVKSSPLLPASLRRAKERIEESQKVIGQYQGHNGLLLKRQSIKRLAFLRKRSKIQRASDGLKASRVELITCFQLLNMYVC